MLFYSPVVGRREGRGDANAEDQHAFDKNRSNPLAPRSRDARQGDCGGVPSAVDPQSAQLSQACGGSVHLANKWRGLTSAFTSSAVLWLFQRDDTIVAPHLLGAYTGGAPSEERFIGF